ncbi:MAG: AsmA family protein [Alphaproteobacteria bacterium]
MKRALLVIVAFVVILAGAAVFLPGFVDLNLYKDHALNEVRDRTGLELQIDGDVSLALLPSPRFMVDNVSVFDPQNEMHDPVASFERLDVSVDLLPLISGEVSVSSLTLVKPKITLEIQKDGRISGYTDKLKALSTSGETETPKEGAGNSAPSISLSDVRIKEGSFHYVDKRSEHVETISNINIDLGMPYLGGDVKAQGSLFNNGRALTFQTHVGAYNRQDQAMNVDVSVQVEPEKVQVKYNGILSFDDDTSAQGKLNVSLNDVSDSLSSYGMKGLLKQGLPFSLSGLISADARSIKCDACQANLGSGRFELGLASDLEKQSVLINIKTISDVVLQELMTGAVPFGTVSLQTVASLQGKKGSFGGDGSFVQLGEQKIHFDGQYVLKPEGRPDVTLSVTTPTLDIDGLTGADVAPTGKNNNSGASLNETVKGSLASVALPLDLHLIVKADKARWQKNMLNGVSLEAKILQNGLDVKNLSIKNFAGSSAKLSMQVKDLKQGRGVSSYVDLRTEDAKATLKALNLDFGKMPDALNRVTIKSKFSGDLDALDMTANIGALNADILLKGQVERPLTKAVMKDVELQVKHGNMARFLKDLSGISIDGSQYTKSLDFYTKLDYAHDVYAFKEIKGDFSGVSVTGNTKVKLSSQRPSVEGALSFGNLIIPSVMNKSTGSHGKKKQSQSRDRWSKQALDVQALHGVNLDLNLKAKKIHYGVWPLSNVAMDFKLQNGEVRINDLKAGVFGGKISLDASVKTQEKLRQPVYFQSYSSFKNVDLGQLSKTLIGKQVVNVSGQGTLDMTLKSSGASPAALIHDLNGNGSVNGSKLILHGVDVTRFARALSEDTKLSDTLTGLWKGTTKGGETHFDTLDGAFRIERGQVNMTKMDLDGPEALVETTGIINLPQWTLNTNHKISVKNEDDRVEPFKMSFSGSLDNPSQTFGQGVLNDYLNRKVQRKFNKILSDNLGGASNDNNKKSGEQGTETQKNVKPKKKEPATIEDVAEDVIKDVIGDLFR